MLTVGRPSHARSLVVYSAAMRLSVLDITFVFSSDLLGSTLLAHNQMAVKQKWQSPKQPLYLPWKYLLLHHHLPTFTDTVVCT